MHRRGLPVVIIISSHAGKLRVFLIQPALCSSVESSVSYSCRKGSTDEYLVIYYDYMQLRSRACNSYLVTC